MKINSPTLIRFTYHRQRRQYLSTALAFIFLVVMEGSLIMLLVGLLAPPGGYKLALLAGLVALYALVVWWILGPLWTAHTLDGARLVLRYNLFRAELPLNTLASAARVTGRLDFPLNVGPRYNSKKDRLEVAFSADGLLQLRLKQPRRFKLGLWRQATTASILLNFDRPNDFLAALSPYLAGPLPRVEQPPAGPSARTPTPATPYILQARQYGPVAHNSGAALIRTENLTRRFGSDFAAVSNLNLAVEPGELYGFLGSNGAGKTTTLKMLVGLLEPTAGRAFIAGHNVWQAPLAAKARLGFVADRSALYERLSGREFLEFLAQVRGLSRPESRTRIAGLVELLELDRDAGRPCGQYSFGMKRKLALAGALLHRPAALILDEPLNGLDPRSARRLKDLLKELAAAGSAILLSTHDLATAEKVCDRVGIIHQGRLMAEGSAADLRRLAAAPDLEAVFLSLTGTAGAEQAVEA